MPQVSHEPDVGHTYKANLMNTEKFQDYHFKARKEYELFKFGPSQVYTLTRSMVIPIVLGNEAKEVEVSIVHANIPFQLGRDFPNKWNCKPNYRQGEEGQVGDEQGRPHHPQAVRR